MDTRPKQCAIDWCPVSAEEKEFTIPNSGRANRSQASITGVYWTTDTKDDATTIGWWLLSSTRQPVRGRKAISQSSKSLKNAGAKLSAERERFCEPIASRDQERKILLSYTGRFRVPETVPSPSIDTRFPTWERTRAKTEMPGRQERL